MPVVSDIHNFDKFVHFTLYAVQAFLLYGTVRWPGRSGFSFARALAIVGVMAVWGVADETHQAWIPGRSMEGADVFADLCGGIFGSLAAAAADRRTTAAGVSGRAART